MQLIFSSIISAVLLLVINIAFAISLAALIFTGPIANYLPMGIGLMLLSYLITGIFIVFGSSIRGIISAPKASICIIISIMTISIIEHLEPDLSYQVMPTVIAVIMISSIFTGLILFLLGAFKIGNLIRYIPYPVIGGYFTGAGLLIVKQSFFTMVNIPLKIQTILLFFEFHHFVLWAPGMFFGIIASLLVKRYDHYIIIPCLLVFGFLLFYIILFLFHIPLDQARKLGLLMSDFSSKPLLPNMCFQFLHDANREVVFKQLGNILSMGLIGSIQILLHVSVLEIETGKVIVLEKDLKVAGIANICSGLLGGFVSFHDYVYTFLSYKIGAKTKLAGILFSALCGIAILYGSYLIKYFPNPVIGGFLFFLGFSILVEWLYTTWFKLPITDYILILIIACIVIFFGFVQGIGAGIFIATILFVLNYSRINNVKFELSGASIKSKVERSKVHQQIINRKSSMLKILFLQGYIFFGTAQKIYDQIKLYLDNIRGEIPPFLVLDFRIVNSMDSSAVKSFKKIQQLCTDKSITLAFSSMNQMITSQMKLEGFFDDNKQKSLLFPTIDYALEWCEKNILEMEKAPNIDKLTICQQLAEMLPVPELVDRFVRYLEPMTIEQGDFLFHQGDQSDSMYFIQSGRIIILLEIPDGKQIRLAAMEAGTVLGEMGLYSRAPRSASVMADTKAVLYRLSIKAFEEMQVDEPFLAFTFHRFVVSILADRIKHLNSQIQALLS
ncbi:MAG: SLC26A/SulP transporter family protein [Desulfobacterales bacterium]|nr:SLC26A/SulP transporter family protein [Desulfobacterales bacterium]